NLPVSCINVRFQQLGVADRARCFVKTMGCDNVRSLQRRLVRTVCKVENVILDLEGHSRGAPEFLHSNEIPPISASNHSANSRRGSKQRSGLQIRNGNALAHASVEVT